MDIGVILTMIGMGGVFIATVISVVWKLSQLAGKVEKSDNTAMKAHERLDKYVSKHETAIEELRQQVQMIVQVQTRIESKVSLLIDGKINITN